MKRNGILLREELYNLVWSKPLYMIAEQFSITNATLKEVCREYNIPLPERSHWQKLRYGKSVNVIPLSKEKEDSPINLSECKALSPLIKLANKIEIENTSLLIVSNKLSRPDSLISTTIAHWKKQKQRDFSLGEKALSIAVTDNCKSRALRFVDSLIKLLKARGHTVETDFFGTYAKVFDIKISFYLREVDKRIPPQTPYGTSEYVPTGFLALKTNKYSNAKEWKDNKHKKIETQLAKIVAKFELDALEEIEWMEKAEADRKLREEEKKIKEKHQKEVEEEIRKFKLLLNDVENYKKAESIRTFLKAKRIKLIKEKGLTPQAVDWLEWAGSKADWLDPLVDKRDDLLEGQIQ